MKLEASTTGWSEPIELTGSLPRTVQTLDTPKILTGLFVGLTTFACLLIFTILFLNTVKISNLQDHGILVHGVVDAMHERRVKDGVRYLVDYSFSSTPISSPEPLRYHGESPVTENDFINMEVGDAVEVKCKRTEPDVSELVISLHTVWASPWRRFQRYCVVVIITLGLPTSLFLTLIGRIYFKERFLVRWGKAAPAKLISQRLVSVRGGRALRITFQFMDDHGQAFMGISGYLPAGDQREEKSIDDHQAWLIKRYTTVLYDHNAPSHNMLYPPTTFCIV